MIGNDAVSSRLTISLYYIHRVPEEKVSAPKYNGFCDERSMQVFLRFSLFRKASRACDRYVAAETGIGTYSTKHFSLDHDLSSHL